MDQQTYLTLKELAKACRLDLEIIRQYEEFGLFPTSPSPEPGHYAAHEVRHLELLHRLHHELDINLEGIEVIIRMRQQLEYLQRETDHLRRQIEAYERLHHHRWMAQDLE